MKKLSVIVLAIVLIFGTIPTKVFAGGLEQNNITNMTEIVSLIAPPSGLTPAKGNGSDETEVIQAIFDYAASAHKKILIPENYTFVVDNLLIYQKDNFSILGYGVLKHKDGAKKSMLKISECSNFTIESLHTDGNVEGNKTNGERVNEALDSTHIINSSDFQIKSINSKNPAGDSLYLNDVNNVAIGTINAKADKTGGRNALSIIKAQNVTIENVISENVGHVTMPGGIDLEPNYATDHIENVKIKAATIKTNSGSGLTITNYANATVKNIEINAVITKSGNPEKQVLKLNNVANFKGNIKCYQQGKELSIGASIVESNDIDVTLEIYNATYGVELGQNSENVNLQGKIVGTTKDGIVMWDGIKNSVIDMEINKVSQGNSDYGAVRVSSGQADNLVFKGNYSFVKSGSYCFKIDGKMTNSRTKDLITNGWTKRNMVSGSNARALLI